MSTEIGTITSEALAQTEVVLGDQTWIQRLQDQHSGLRAVSNMRQRVYPQISRFLSLDPLYGFSAQKDILQSSVKTVVEGCLIGKFIISELQSYEKNNFQDFFSNLKNGRKRDPLFTPQDAWSYLRYSVFYILSANNFPNEIKHALLTPEDSQYNNLAFQFESQRLFLQMYEKWVENNISVILQNARDYSRVVEESVAQTLNGVEPVAPSKIVERVVAQRNSVL